ncbi:DUF4352 domain-containing protein [Streptomyces sp. NPDC001661]
MNTRAALAATVLLTAVLTACGTNDEPGTIRVTVTETVTRQPKEQAAPKQEGPLSFGDKKAFDDADNDVHASVQVLGYTHTEKGPEAPGEELGGDSWATADVKVCNVRGVEISVDQTAWSLSYADGTSMETTGLSGGDMPKPEFPMDKTLRAGQCARGKVAFPVHVKKRPSTLDYAPEGQATSATQWAVPKA